VAGLSFRGIAADGVSLWYSTAGGAVDFSGTHTQNAIWCDGGSSIHGDQITAPPEGLGYIFNPDPDSLPADTTVLGVWVSGAEASGAPGTADSAVVLMQNLSTGAHTLQYSFWSARAWVEPAGGGVGPLVPFAVCSLFVHFVVPAGAEPGNQDTVFLVVSIGPAYAETCLSTITCTGEPPGTREQSQGPVSGWFRVQSPFKGRAAAVYELAARSLVSVVVYDAVGRQVRVLLRGFAEPGRGTLKWDGKDESGRVMPAGAYVLRFESGAVCAAANLLKLE